MDSYQNYFRKLDIFFSGKQQGAIRTERKIYDGNNIQGSYITFDIFNNWTFFSTIDVSNKK